MAIDTEQLNILLLGIIVGAALVNLLNFVSSLMGRDTRRMKEKERNKLIDTLQEAGFTVYGVIQGRSDRMNHSQLEAAIRLLYEGCLVFSDDRGLEALLYKLRPTKDELVKQRRAQFRLVD